MKRRARPKAAATEVTPRQERFAQLVVSGKSQADAYRGAYDAKRMSAAAIHVAASRLMDNPKIALRVAELRAPLLEEMGYDLKQAMEEAGHAMRMAEKQGQAGPMVQAITLRAKLNGLLVEDRRNERRQFQDLTDDELERAAVETERAIARAQGTG